MNSFFKSQQKIKNILLTDKQLRKADFNSVIRLAKWLNVLPDKASHKIKTLAEYKQKVIIAILREEKRLFRLVNQGRKDE